MKIKIIIALVFLTAACTQNRLEKGEFRLMGKVEGMKKGRLYLLRDETVDTLVVDQGEFNFKSGLGQNISRAFITTDLSLRTMESGAVLYLEPKNMELMVNVRDWNQTVLEGSVTQNEKYVLDSLRKDTERKFSVEVDELNRVSKKYRKAAERGADEKELEAIKEEDYIARENLGPYFKELNELALSFIKGHPDSYISMENMLFLLRDMKYGEAITIYNALDPKLKEMKIGREVFSEIENMKKGVPGAKAEYFKTKDIEGNTVKLDDFKGKYLLIDFWASWCVPCRKGNPHLIGIYKKYNTAGLEILGVASDDRDPAAWKAAVKKDNIGIWHHVLSGLTRNEDGSYNKEKDIGEGYNISTLPTKILVNPDGIIVGRYGSGGETDEKLDAKLEEIFNK
ncbi:TlpA disulfide reductase family protein [Sinomicrobium weinanense]|uniref:Redoxin domain-containing protein n=1 Tax=Sinomicrobium weinanense TaxID=2842200 RepID=A0A926JR37_9FLAO|nr:TlpA disulfide reductase family protein [Sinomicrobium weinanense]MBC9795826.1 redoxin domain-containing protein [Sinomicrobium weinanense]MBU3121870.1 AhpC/TSA family protein [Sinomicrobium weinanense]